VTPQRWLGTELGLRVASALVLGVVTLFLTYQGGWLFALFWLVAGVATLVEWIGITRVERRWGILCILSAGLVALTGLYLRGDSLGTGTAVGLAFGLAALLVARSNRDRVWATGGFLYAGVISLVPTMVRDFPAIGLVGILWIFAVVWATDVAAYFTGRHFGGPKLWPSVSPKKTWSGFAGGMVAGTVAGLAVALLAGALGQTVPLHAAIIVIASAIASGASQLGDLAESALKRAFDVKDSSHLIPGHGGVMDRLDGFWAVAALIGFALLGVHLTRTLA
jgi:phosphatidate cytidylyltransferase